MKPDLIQARRFLSLFNFEKITYQYLRKGKPAGYGIDVPMEQLEAEASKGKEIFFMVNEGDGEVYPGNKTARSQENVHTLTACFIDTDEAPGAQVAKYLNKIGLKPHIVVETSPRKYHLYFLLQRSPLTERSLEEWKACQVALAHLGEKEPQCDTSMRDYSRVLRVPGFHHLKNAKSPFLTRVYKEFQLPLYTLKDILERTEAGNHIESSIKTSYSIKDSKVRKGQRHEEMTAFLGSVLNTGLNPDIAKLAFEAYAKKTFDKPDEFLTGERAPEVNSFIDWKLKALEKERKQASMEAAVHLLESSASDPFALSDDFYFKAPGIIGEITQEITSKARYPIAPFAFASAIAAVGTLKGRAVETEMGHAPSNYFLCLAPTGTGKNYAQEVLSHTFKKLKCGSLIESGIRSDKGMARFLERNNYQGCLMVDEAEGFFQSLSDKTTPHHLKQCRSFLLESYSSTNIPEKHLGSIGNKKDKPIILKYPRLNVVAYAVSHSINTAFDSKSVADGLLQRFIVLTSAGKRNKNPDFTPARALNGNYFDHLKGLAIDSSLCIEEEIDAEEELETKLPDFSARKIVKFTPKARKLYEEFADYCDSLINAELDRHTGLEGIYTRAAEQVGRLAAVFASDSIDIDTMTFLTDFMKNRLQAMQEVIGGYAKGDFAKELEDLQNFVASKARENRNPVVTYREILTGFRVRDGRKLKELLGSAVEADLLTRHESYRKEGSKHGRKGVGYSISDLDQLTGS